MKLMNNWGMSLIFLITLLTAACQTQPIQIFIEVDGGRQALNTEVATVREALAEAKISLNSLDRVEPDLYASLEPGLVIVVTRVKEEIESKREIVPFERQTVINETLAADETRLVQLGVNGEEEISIRVVYENGVEVSRSEISRVTIIEAVPEILVTGTQGELPSIPFDGTIAFLSNGNAWLMRGSSGSRRALTTASNLDGRVLSLSPDGRQLLYTTKLTDEIEMPLNEMWLASTTIVGEPPITTGVQGVLQAAWSPVISESLIVYSTAERVANPPGWQANNDLWLLDLGNSNPTPVELLPPSTEGLYPWWGTSFTWSPDGSWLAYARADQIGIANITTEKVLTSTVTPLIDFTPLKTFSEWVWVPQLSWSPDGKFIAATIHGPPVASEPDDESQVFDLWLISADNTLSAKVETQVGMWANPAWGEAGIAFGEALNPLQSATSRYTIQMIDRDGSNKRQLFPFREEPGVQFPELAWSPTGRDLLFIYNGNLYITSSNGSPPKQLTVDSQASRPQWVSQTPVITDTTSVTHVIGITSSKSITANGIITGNISTTTTNATATGLITPTIEATRSKPTVTATFPITNSVTITPTSTVTRTPTPSRIIPEASPTIEPTTTISTPNSSGQP